MSVVALDNQLYTDIKIDDKDLPSGLPNFLVKLAVLENVVAAPVLDMIVNDTADVFSTAIPLTDSNKFSITLGTSISDIKANRSFDFRLFNWDAEQYQSGFTYALNAIFDNYPFIKNVKSKAYRGSSNDVMNQIAKDCSLDIVNNDMCSDGQTWLNFSDPLSTFMRKVVQHSYIQNGCMMAAITADGTLVYKDIIKAINGEAVAEFNNADTTPTDEFETVHLMSECKPSSSAGFMNAWINYGYTITEDSLSGETDLYSACTLTSTSGGHAVINQQVSDSIDTTRKDYVNQDCGNTHKNYWKAYHNNLRILSLFSQKLVFMTDQVTNLSLLDVVSVKLMNVVTGTLTGYSGKYIIGAKKSMIKGTKYAEFFEVYRNTVPNSGNISLSSSAPPAGVTSIERSGSSLPDMQVVLTGNTPLPESNYIAPSQPGGTHLPTSSDVLGVAPVVPVVVTDGQSTSGETFVVAVQNTGEPVL